MQFVLEVTLLPLQSLTASRSCHHAHCPTTLFFCTFDGYFYILYVCSQSVRALRLTGFLFARALSVDGKWIFLLGFCLTSMAGNALYKEFKSFIGYKQFLLRRRGQILTLQLPWIKHGTSTWSPSATQTLVNWNSVSPLERSGCSHWSNARNSVEPFKGTIHLKSTKTNKQFLQATSS